ncbi:MAG: DUF1905 domain-containing protein, partial [Crocinitomicaceae bacterium]|nr:DUF1905 domain-containing protein [Crocinitomicaceae bacterium]
LFLPVKAEIRKKIKKQAGDTVHVILFADNLPTEIPEELKACFLDVPGVLEKFQQLSNGEQKTSIDWIYAAKTEETKAKRILATIEKLESK